MILERGNNLDCRDYAASEVPYGTLGTFTWLDPISTISGPLETWKNHLLLIPQPTESFQSGFVLHTESSVLRIDGGRFIAVPFSTLWEI